jgi:hypothetical protein
MERGHPVRRRAAPAPYFALRTAWERLFALRAQADKMSALRLCHARQRWALRCITASRLGESEIDKKEGRKLA